MSSSAPGPSSSGSGSAPSAGAATKSSAAPASQATTTATPGAFARRFPRLHSTITRYASSRPGKIATSAWVYKRPIAFGLFATYGVASYIVYSYDAYLRDVVHPDSWLVLKVYPGSIVEARSSTSILALVSSPSAGEDIPRVMELFELVRAINLAAKDKRIKGLFADFSGVHIPSSVTPSSLGLAQIEEIVSAIHTFRSSKQQDYLLEQTAEKLNAKAEAFEDDEQKIEMAKAAVELLQGGNETKQVAKTGASADSPDMEKQAAEAIEELHKDLTATAMPTTTIAWADSFDSQGSYLLASAFEKVYIQPSGSVPLVGVRMELPFFKRALDWLGVKVYAEARREYKSMISSFTREDGLPMKQLENETTLLGELGRSVAFTVGVNRYPEMDPNEAADKVMALSRKGPFSAQDAQEHGLISGIKYKREALKLLGEEPKLRTLGSYSNIMDKLLKRTLHEDQRPKVAVVYLTGSISDAPGDFSASSAIKGLKEAAEDDDVTSIVLRIDSGGGSAITSDSIWDAVMRVREDSGKPVVASFGNMSASGGYFAAAAADAILAGESTVTGSIGVASLRPTFTKSFFDRIGVRMQTLFTGSNVFSAVHELDDEGKADWAKGIDSMYAQFLDKVCKGRDISPDVIEELAGGRVWTGYHAYLHCRADEAEADKGKIEEVKEKDDAHTASDEASASTGNETGELLKTMAQTKTPKPDVVLQWDFNDVSREGEMSTYRISAGPARSKKAKSTTPQAADDEESSVTQAIAEMVTSEEGQGAEEARIQPVPTTHDDEESRLAAAAHADAAKSHEKEQATTDASTEPDKPKLGPYGRGLVDGLGGLLDAGTLALNMGVQAELDILIKDGMTPEQAMNSIRPGAPRQTEEDGSTQLVMDLRLSRYPREKGFRERVRELNRKGDEPSLSLFFPGITRLGAEIKTWLNETAVQMLVRVSFDPASLQRVLAAAEREQSRQQIRLESSHNVLF